ncbi:MAG: aminopeptidase [Betaproteobacteria bacterium]|nr:aminopeptidase [Betaproteobacteria bacterium]
MKPGKSWPPVRSKAALWLLPLLALAGCAGTGYYWQAAVGQMGLWQSARSLDVVLDDPATSAHLREQLALAMRVREFASRELGLPDNGSYRRYADLRRPYVVWNVFATEEFRVEAQQWCFPVAGCVAYRGYFSRPDAEAHAGQLRGAGLDVHVGGVPAYSTLGAFDDPLLNTFIHYPEAELARLIFHELAHQVAYASDDSEFNEGFAVVVETEGLRRWLLHRKDASLAEAVAANQRRRQDFVHLVLDAREQLRRAFAHTSDDGERRRLKSAILARLKADYGALRDGPWQGYRGYDRWFGQEINNATLASVGIYEALVPHFQALLARRGGELPRFYLEVKKLAARPKSERESALAAAAADVPTSPPPLSPGRSNSRFAPSVRRKGMHGQGTRPARVHIATSREE